MGIQMNISEAKAKLSELVRRAEAGEEVLLMRDGTVVAVLRSFTPKKGGMRTGLLNHVGLNNPSQFLEGADEDEMVVSPDPADVTFAPRK